MKHSKRLIIALFATLCPALAHSAPLALSDTPLISNNTVPPNIGLIIDNSLSMASSILTLQEEGEFSYCDGTSFLHVAPHTHFELQLDFAPTHEKLLEIDPARAAAMGTWRLRNHDYNVIYYNPNVTYGFWAAESPAQAISTGPIDPSNTPIEIRDSRPEQFFNLAEARPYRTNFTCTDSNGTEVEFESEGDYYVPTYYEWIDTNSNGIVDANDGYNLIEIKASTPNYPNRPNRTDCAAAPTCTYEEELKNFANWFVYQRRRMSVLKFAYTNALIDITGVNVGLFNLGNEGRQHRFISMSNQEDKDRLLQFLIENGASERFTRLRQAFKRAHEYMACSSNAVPANFGAGNTCARLLADKGGECQAQALLTMTDGYYNGPSITIGNADGDNNSQWDGKNYGDTYSNTLADIAMHHYETDHFPNYADRVPSDGNNQSNHQRTQSYTITFGVDGTLSRSPINEKESFTWPKPVAGTLTTVDDVRHAAYNGRGLYLSARRPRELTRAVKNILARIIDLASSGSAVSFNSTSLNVDALVYRASFDTTNWQGTLTANRLATAANPCASTIGSTCDTAWEAGSQLSQQTPDNRKLYTYNPLTQQGTTFTYSQLTQAQKNLLNYNPTSESTDNLGSARLDYLRGSNAQEQQNGGTFRNRTTLLGDIINSNPFYVGQPNARYNIDGYNAFASQHSNRIPAVYVGANDGMLHAFNANTGKELFSYIPNSVFGNLSQLPDPFYLHKYYVDGDPIVVDAQVSGTWKSVLVSNLRKGAQGIFALDVTNPGTFNANNVMWEFTDADDADLGYVYSPASIARMNNGKWAAIISSGYNADEADEHTSNSTNGHLFIIFLDGPGADGVWNEGSDYIKIATTNSNTNNLAEPKVVDVDNDAKADYIYVGDLQGYLWRFDVIDSSTSSWQLGHNKVPLFIADGPITTQPSIGVHPQGINRGYMVYFGTGKYLEQSDIDNDDTQAFYGIWDDRPKPPTTNHTPASNPPRAPDILAQTITGQVTANGDACTEGPTCFRKTSNNPIDWNTHRGWKIDLVSPSGATNGERQITNSQLRDGRIRFTTTEFQTTSDPCENRGGGWFMILDANNGGRFSEPVIDTNGDNLINNDDINTTGTGLIGTPADVNSIQTNATTGSTEDAPTDINLVGGEDNTPIQEKSSNREGRNTWRQLQ